MKTRYIPICLHHSGYFIGSPWSEYSGGKVTIFYNNDVDKLSLFEYKDMLKEVQQVDIVCFYYRVHGLDIRRGLKKLATNLDNNVMVLSSRDIYSVDIYVLHSWQDEAATDVPD